MNTHSALLCSVFLGVAGGLFWGCSSQDQDCRSCGNGGEGGSADDGNGGEGDSADDGNGGEGESAGDGDGVVSYDQGSSFCLGHSGREAPDCSPVTFEADTSLSVRVDFGCRPCADQVQVSCSATVAGDVVTIETFVAEPHGQSDCVSGGDEDGYACDEVFAECAIPALSKGRYRVVHGEQAVDVQVPSTVAGACSPLDPTPVCCLDDAQCAFFETCADHQCTAIDCDTSTRCPEGSFCKSMGYCSACECPEGLACGPHSDRCALAESVGPAYQRCDTNEDCEGQLEYCLTEAHVCMARCFDSADCEPVGDPAFESECINHDGVTDNWSCVIPCGDASPRCPDQMECYLGLFCAFAD